VKQMGAICATLLLAVLDSTLSFASSPVTPDNVRLLREEVRIRVSLYPEDVLFLDDTRIVIADGTARSLLWDLTAPTGTPPRDLAGMGAVLALSADGSTLACVTSGTVSLWTSDSFQKLADLQTLSATPNPTAAFAPSGNLLAVTNQRDDIQMVDLTAGTLVATLTGHNSNLFDLAFSPDGRMLATAGGWSGSTTDADSCIKVWDVASGALLATLPTIDLMDNHAMAFSPDSVRLFSGAAEGFAAWDTETWARIHTSPGGSYGLAVSPDGRLLALASWEGVIRLVNLATMRTARDLGAPATPLGVSFSPDGTRLAASFDDGTVIVWQMP